MAYIVGKKTEERDITLEGEDIPSFSLTVERPDKPAQKEFALLWAEYFDCLEAHNNAEDKRTFKEKREALDAAEQALQDFMIPYIKGWDDVHAEVDQQVVPLAFNEKNLLSLLRDSKVSRAVFDDFRRIISGNAKAAEKNSSESAGTTS